MNKFLLSICLLALCTTTLFAQEFSVNLSPATNPTINTIVSFAGNNGNPGFPSGSLAQGRDGDIYGTSSFSNTIWKVTPTGSISLLHDFDASLYGSFPGVTLGRDGKLYGVSEAGGGRVWSFDPTTLVFANLHTFTGTEGFDPQCVMAQGADGNFYGTTNNGGPPSGHFGTAFKITPSGTVTIIHGFAGGPTDGAFPTGPLFLSIDGNFYGTTGGGGAFSNNGTVYRMTPAGKVTILHSFNGTDGSSPLGGVIQAADGSFYGPTQIGGPNNRGTVFKVTASKKFTSLHDFTLATDHGDIADNGLAQTTDGNIYGDTTDCYAGGCDGSGILYKIGAKSVFSVVADFAAVPPFGPVIPSSPPLAHTNGNLYGVTQQGGVNNYGSFYSLSTTVSPFVTLQTRSGKAGTSVNILGQGFNSATAVAFNGKAAAFTIVSDTFMTAIIPALAKTGYVTVTTASGVLKSGEVFRQF